MSTVFNCKLNCPRNCQIMFSYADPFKQRQCSFHGAFGTTERKTVSAQQHQYMTGFNPKSSQEFFTFLSFISLNPTCPSNRTTNEIKKKNTMRPIQWTDAILSALRSSQDSVINVTPDVSMFSSYFHSYVSLVVRDVVLVSMYRS